MSPDKDDLEPFPWMLVLAIGALWLAALLFLIDAVGCSASTPC